MRTTLRCACAAAALALALALPAAARASVPGLGVAFRGGYSLPSGGVSGASGDGLSGYLSGTVPLQLDLGVRVNRHLAVAAYSSYAFGVLASGPDRACANLGLSCSGHTWRTGLELLLHPAPRGNADPWLGVGAGYEWGSFSYASAGRSVDLSAHGWEFLNAQVGLDLRSGEVGFGPFFMVSLAQYDTASVTRGGVTSSGSIDPSALHAWFTFGVRGTYGL